MCGTTPQSRSPSVEWGLPIGRPWFCWSRNRCDYFTTLATSRSRKSTIIGDNCLDRTELDLIPIKSIRGIYSV